VESRNQGGRALAAELERRKWTHTAAEQALACSRGLVSRLISGERRPGRALSIALEKKLGIEQRLWDEPLVTKRRTGTGG
jgi:plasmid maintenance system antidote protein VapI